MKPAECDYREAIAALAAATEAGTDPSSEEFAGLRQRALVAGIELCAESLEDSFDNMLVGVARMRLLLRKRRRLWGYTGCWR